MGQAVLISERSFMAGYFNGGFDELQTIRVTSATYRLSALTVSHIM